MLAEITQFGKLFHVIHNPVSKTILSYIIFETSFLKSQKSLITEYINNADVAHTSGYICTSLN